LVTSLVNYIITHDVTDKQLDNAVAYINGMSAEFAILTAKDILISGNRKLTSRILATDSWDVFTEQYESFVNDYIS
jgi:hypothetical protein